MAKTVVDLSNLGDVVNPVYLPLLYDKSRYHVLMGGAGSGKSRWITQKRIIRALTEPTLRHLTLRKVGTQVRNSIWQETLDVINSWNLKRLFSENKTEMILTARTGAVLMFKGMDDPEKIKSIASLNSIDMEEATEFEEEDFMQLNLRLRGHHKSNKQFQLAFNPVSEFSWLKPRFFDQDFTHFFGVDGRCLKRNVKVRVGGVTQVMSAVTLKTTHRDNLFIDPEYAAMLEEMKFLNPSMYRIYGEGEWGTIGGLIYNPPPKAIPDFEMPHPQDVDEIFYGLDFGFNHPTALVEVMRKGSYLFVREVIYESNLTLEELAAKIPYLIRTNSIRGNKSIPIYADAASPDKIQELRDRTGLNIIAADKGSGSVSDGIYFVQSCTPHMRYNYNSHNLGKEFRTYAWQRDKNAIGEIKYLDKPVKFKDDLMDALRYALHTHMNRIRSGTRLGSLTGKKVFTGF